uniref:Uncharacterized protein n=1 Tax=Romanomermis culicivorax TaxID=13658 RepID=A0A915K401_ROMCU
MCAADPAFKKYTYHKKNRLAARCRCCCCSCSIAARSKSKASSAAVDGNQDENTIIVAENSNKNENRLEKDGNRRTVDALDIIIFLSILRRWTSEKTLL